MHEFLFSQAVLPEPAQVLGLSLRPYSIGHELFLIREQNPLVAGECSPEHHPLQEITPGHLAQAALVCCQTFAEARGMGTDWLLGLKLWLWHRRISGFDFCSEMVAFRRYRQAGSLELPVSQIERPGQSAGRMAGTPFLLRMQQFLMMRLGLSEADAWDYPLGLAKMRWEAHAEEEGALDIYNLNEAEHDEFVSQMEREEAAETLKAEAATQNMEAPLCRA